MSRTTLATILTVSLSGLSLAAQEPAAKWWAHIVFLANDSMNGRDTGSPEHRKAAEYIADEFKTAGLEPGGTNGYFQPIRFRSRKIVEAQSSLTLVRPDGAVESVELGEEATFSMRIEPAPSVEAPIVFAGYGLQVPESKHDDLAGLDLKGKIVLLLTGGPSNIPGPLLAHYQSVRWEYLKKAGAVGVFSIQNPKGQDIPWDRSKLSRFMPALAIADPALDETLGQQTAVTVNPARAERFFAGSGHTFKELLALSNDGKVLPRFVIPATARVKVAIEAKTIDSDNVIGVLRGTDPTLRNEYVAVSAHLDHVGVGEPIGGDRIYNGAMDNASGIATLIETAAAASAAGASKRSIVFVAVTAEEKGLLGSRYFANRPSVAGTIVANLNTDMFLPLFPLKSLVVQGLEESDLAEDLKRVARPLALEVLSDPEPERNAFIRSDQYSFIKTGVPALSLKVGFVKDSPEHLIVRKWRTERYHAPSDDLAQPINRQAAEDFGKVYLAVVQAVASRATRPQWNSSSFFRRFEVGTGSTTPKSVLFIGNSFLFGSGSAVRFYRAETVTDLNGEGNGGVPALFKSFTQQAGLDYDVSLETRGGSGLDFHLANKLDVIGKRGWDTVVMHGFSLLDADKPRDPAKLVATSKQMADVLRAKNPGVTLYLMATWARADHVYPAKGTWTGQPVEVMARDVRAGYDRAAAAAKVKAVIPVGEAWTRAMQTGVADPNPYDGIDAGKLNLWTFDHYHASTHGYYLEALVIFGSVTGRDPRSLGDRECSAYELGLSRTEVKALQQVAFDQLASAGPVTAAAPAPAAQTPAVTARCGH